MKLNDVDVQLEADSGADVNIIDEQPRPQVYSLSNLAAVGEKNLAPSKLKRSLIDAFHGVFIRAL